MQIILKTENGRQGSKSDSPNKDKPNRKGQRNIQKLSLKPSRQNAKEQTLAQRRTSEEKRGRQT